MPRIMPPRMTHNASTPMKLMSRKLTQKSRMLKALSALLPFTLSKVLPASFTAADSISPRVAIRIPLRAPWIYLLSPKFSMNIAISIMITKDGSRIERKSEDLMVAPSGKGGVITYEL